MMKLLLFIMLMLLQCIQISFLLTDYSLQLQLMINNVQDVYIMFQRVTVKDLWNGNGEEVLLFYIDYYPLNRNEYEKIKFQLEYETKDDELSKNDDKKEENESLLKQRVKLYC